MPTPPPPQHAAEVEQQVVAAKVLQTAFANKMASTRNLGTVDGAARPGAADFDRHLYRGDAPPPPPPGGGVSNPLQAGSQRHAGMLQKRWDEDDDEEPWDAPSPELAREYADFHHPRTQDGFPFPFCSTTTGRHCVVGGLGDQCDPFNEGVASDFVIFGSGVTNYFKFVKWAGWMWLLAFVLASPMVVLNSFGDGATTDLMDLSTMTIGNLGDSVNVSFVYMPNCDNKASSSCQMDKEAVAVAYAYLDCAVVLLLLVGFGWLRKFEKREADKVDRNTITAADYSVYVKHVPEFVSEMVLRKHFAEVTGHPVATVSVGEDNEPLIALYRERGRLIAAKEVANAQIRYLRHQQTEFEDRTGMAWPGASDLEEAIEHRDELASAIRDCNKRRSEVPRGEKALVAYVTFETEQGALEALLQYPHNPLSYLFQSARKRLQGRRLKVTRAPEPSTVLWENLAYTTLDKYKRRALSSVFAFFMLAASLGLGFMAKEYQQQVEEEGGTEYCPVTWDSLTEDEQRAVVTEDKELIHCYCGELSSTEAALESLCSDYLWAQTQAVIITAVASLGVVGINAALQVALKKMARSERHHSLDNQEAAVFKSVFLLVFLNTGVVMLATSSETVLSSLDSSLNGSQDFDTTWYETVGTTLQFTMLLNVVSPHMAPMLRVWRARRKLRARQDQVRTQRELNALYLGPEFHLSVRYAQVLSMLFVTLMYSAGMPIMLAVGAFSCFASYWIDRYLFLRFYRTPPQYDNIIGERVTALIPWGIGLHLCMAIWMYGNETIFTSPTTGTDGYDTVNSVLDSYDPYDLNYRLTQEHVVPLVVMLCGVIVLCITNSFLDTIHLAFNASVRFITCGHSEGVARALENLNKVQVSYTNAVKRGLLVGLQNYNILQVPTYMEAFAISESFAEHHTHVGSVAELETGSSMDLA